MFGTRDLALFFLAFLPHFVDASSPSRVAAFLFLGGLFLTTGTAWCLALLWCASAWVAACAGTRPRVFW